MTVIISLLHGIIVFRRLRAAGEAVSCRLVTVLTMLLSDSTGSNRLSRYRSIPL